MPRDPSSSSIPADPTRWSEKSQATLSAVYIKEYKDKHYRCWHCQANAVFTAADQKYTYEVKKAPIDQQRILCETCWRESLKIRQDLDACDQAWAQSKTSMRADLAFLGRWLELLERLKAYVPYRPDTAKQNMLRKLLGDA